MNQLFGPAYFSQFSLKKEIAATNINKNKNRNYLSVEYFQNVLLTVAAD